MNKYSLEHKRLFLTVLLKFHCKGNCLPIETLRHIDFQWSNQNGELAN